MTWFLEEAAAAPVPTAPAGPPSTFGDRFTAARTLQRIEDDSWNHALGVEGDVLGEYQDQLKEFRDPNERPAVMPMYAGAFPTAQTDPYQRANVLKLITRARAADPVKWADLPKDEDDLNRLILERRQAEYDEAQNVLDRAPPDAFGAEFLGRSWAGLSDEISIASLPFGGPAGKGAVGFARMLAGEAAAGAASELAIAPRRQDVAADLDVPEPNLVADVLTAGLTAAGFVGGLHGIAKGAERFFAYRSARGAAAGDAAPIGVSPGQNEGRIKDAGEELATGKPPAAKATLPPIAPDAPENWQAIRGGIFAGESGGDYNALFSYANRDGGPFANVKLTEMSVDDAIAFSNPRGEYAAWVRGKVGRTATPMGAYQIVGTTLREAKKALGLRGDELMDEAMQERLGQFIYRTQGTGAWEGYRGPNAGFKPGEGGGYSGPADFRPTSRGYTGDGQMTVGDRRIDVEHVVVDANLLTKATGRFQPRDRSRINSDAWIADTAARLDPAQLMQSPTASHGAPLVGPDMMIESGNGRFAAIQRAYAEHPDRAAAYRQQIEAAGFAIPADVKQPVLVAKRTSALTDAEREQLAIDAQDGGTARMTPTERARTGARTMTAERMATYQPAAKIGDEGNRPFLQSVLSSLPASERNALFDEGGALNADGRRMMQQAFFARAWDDGGPMGRDLLGRYAEIEDAGELKGLMDALDQAAPAWATLRAEIEAGAVRAEFDITPHVLDALGVIMQARREASRAGGSIADAIEAILDQGDLFVGPNPLSVALLRKFWRDGRAAPSAEIAKFLNRYADEARTAGRSGDLLGASPADALRAIDAKTFADLPDDIPPIETAPPPRIEEPALSETAFAKGADSPEAEAADQLAMEDLKRVGSDATTDTGAVKALDDTAGQGTDTPRNIVDPATADKIDRQIAAKRAEFDALGDFTLPDGTRASDLLADLDEDQNLLDVLDACLIGGNRQ